MFGIKIKNKYFKKITEDEKESLILTDKISEADKFDAEIQSLKTKNMLEKWYKVEAEVVDFNNKQ